VLKDTIARSIDRKTGRPSISFYSNILKQINAKLRLDLYRLKFNYKNAMVIGVDVVNEGTRSIIGFAATSSKHLTQHFSKVVYQDMQRELIGTAGKDVQEKQTTKDRTEILIDLVREALDKH